MDLYIPDKNATLTVGVGVPFSVKFSIYQYVWAKNSSTQGAPSAFLQSIPSLGRCLEQKEEESRLAGSLTDTLISEYRTLFSQRSPLAASVIRQQHSPATRSALTCKTKVSNGIPGGCIVMRHANFVVPAGNSGSLSLQAVPDMLITSRFQMHLD